MPTSVAAICIHWIDDHARTSKRHSLISSQQQTHQQAEDVASMNQREQLYTNATFGIVGSACFKLQDDARLLRVQSFVGEVRQLIKT